MASLAIIVVALPEVQENKCSNFYPQDCAAATQNILISATSLGYGSCWCGVYPNMDRVQVINDILNIKEGLTFNIIALGKSKYEKNGLGFFEEEKVSYIK